MVEFLRLFEARSDVPITKEYTLDIEPSTDSVVNFKDSNGCYGEAEFGENFVSIYWFSSSETGKGNAEKTLRELKQMYNMISVIGAGRYEDDLSMTFWKRMLEKGIVDYVEDDEGQEVKLTEIEPVTLGAK